MSRRPSAWQALVLSALAGAGFGCGSADPAPPPATSPRPARPTPTPAATPAATPVAAATPTPTKPPEPALLRVQVIGPAGSYLVVGEARIALPGTLEFALQRKASQPVTGRLSLNALSQSLEIPSSARDLVEGDARGVYVRVQGTCQVAAGAARGPIRLRLTKEGLLRILRGKGLTLSDPQARVQLVLKVAEGD